MTATDELRKLLDERGVEYETADGWWTSWDTAGSLDVDASVYCEDLGSGLEIRWHTITPEQAVTATLGSKRESELKDALNEVAEKWAIAQVQAADSARRCKFLETLVRDWQELYENPDYGECLRLIDRMCKLGIEVEQ